MFSFDFVIMGILNLNILISGSTGFVGNNLVDFLTKNNHKVIRLVRKEEPYPEKQIYWNPNSGKMDINKDEKIDAVVHLAGENVGEGKWTEEKKKKIVESRLKSTKLLVENIIKLETKPKVFVSASAVGFYGNRGDEKLTEESKKGNDFLSDTCQEWEKYTKIVQESGIRTVVTRIGVVLDDKHGALSKMIFPFKMGVGGILGNGKQYMSWIDIQDLVRLIDFCISNDSVNGVVNAVSPNSVTNSKFTSTLGKVLSRPTLFPLPQFVGKIIFGEMGDALLFSGQNVSSEKIVNLGFKFNYPDLEKSLNRIILGKK